MALAFPLAPQISASAPPPRLARWVWLAVTSLSAACFVALVAQPVQAQEGAAPPLKTESPYFFVPNGDPALDLLPLKSTQVDVRISGVIADVTVTQRYKNEGQRAIEAKYVFPGSTRAAVHGMNVRLADRLITANIREKNQARLEYDNAKKEGKTAALLEQHLPNVFQMNVANILPGDDVKVELHYTELLVPTSGNYQFVFPTVVGPRYNRDFILDYRLAGERIESGVMLYKGGDENFFLAMIEPPKAVPASAISPRDYIFVVDISGSMHGCPR